MRRWLWLVILGLVGGVLLSSLLALDPGYALLQVSGYRLETTVVALGLIGIAAILLLRLTLRMLRLILGVGPNVGRWLGKRKEDREAELLYASLDAVLTHNASSLAQKLDKLKRSSRFSALRLQNVQHWLLVEQLQNAQKLAQVKKVWADAPANQKLDDVIKAQFATQLCRLGATAEAENALLELADSSWPSAANGVLAVHCPSDGNALMTKLAVLSKSKSAGSADMGLLLLKAWALGGDEGEKLLIDAHSKRPDAHLISAVGSLRLAQS